MFLEKFTSLKGNFYEEKDKDKNRKNEEKANIAYDYRVLSYYHFIFLIWPL